jgi:hypothetical protein
MNAKLGCWACVSGTLATLLSTAPLVRASDAATTASATNGRGGSSATATARYEGERGFARTDTRTGQVSAARAVAVGVDQGGVSLSVSLAVAPQSGPAYATNFNMSFDLDGGSSFSGGSSLATGGHSRTVSAGGQAGTGCGAKNVSTAGGVTLGGGCVKAHTVSERKRPGERIKIARR